MVPFTNLSDMYRDIEVDIEEDILHILRHCDFSANHFIERFESNFAGFLDINHVVGVSSGTDALMIALEALNIGDRDRVIVPVNAPITTAFAVTRSGATPLFVDVDPDSYLIDVEQVEKLLSKKSKHTKIKAIVAVDRYGQMPDLERLSELAKAHDVYLIEEAAIGATYQGRLSGYWCHVAVANFEPTMNLGACGHAGAVMVNDREIADSVRTIANEGSRCKYQYTHLGGTYKLNAIMAAQLYHALKKVNEWVANRRKVASYFNNSFLAANRPTERPNSRHSYNLYQYKCDTAEIRNVLALRLKSRGIGFGFYNPTIITDSPIYQNLKMSTPVAADLANRLIALPMFPTMTDYQANQIIASVQAT